MRTKYSIARAALLAVCGAGLIAAFPAGAAADKACQNDELVVDDTNQPTVEAALFCLVNKHRADHGIPLLQWDPRLATAARLHSVDMDDRDFFDHVNPDGLDPSARAALQGYPGGAGENIAYNAGAPGDGTAWSLFDQWRESCGHNENMLRGWYAAAGFGVTALLGPGIIGTQMFGIEPAVPPGDTGVPAFGALPPPRKSDPCAAPPGPTPVVAVPSFGPSNASKPKKCKKKKRGKRRKCKKR